LTPFCNAIGDVMGDVVGDIMGDVVGGVGVKGCEKLLPPFAGVIEGLGCVTAGWEEP